MRRERGGVSVDAGENEGNEDSEDKEEKGTTVGVSSLRVFSFLFASTSLVDTV